MRAISLIASVVVVICLISCYQVKDLICGSGLAGQRQGFGSIQDAIDAAEPGDTIHVPAGTYFEHLTINKSIAIIGENSSTTILDGSKTGVLVEITSSNVSLSGFSLCNADKALRIVGVHNCEISNNLIFSISGYNGIAIHATNCENITIQNNYSTDVDMTHVHLEQTRSSRIIRNCFVANKRYSQPIFLYYSDENVIGWNQVLKEGLMNEGGIGLLHSNLNTICYNNVVKTDWAGISLLSSNYNTIEGNTIREVTWNSNSGALRMKDCWGGSVNQNNFIANTRDVFLSSSANISWNNTNYGNYWDTYTGRDENNDGIGDTPHTIATGNIDSHPLMGIFHRFETAKNNETFSVYAISNSTINDVTYSTNSTYPKGLLYLNVSGSPATNGICLLIFSKALIEPPYNVTIEEHLPSLLNDLSDDQTATLFFAYSHESLQTSIMVTWKTSIRVPQDYPTIQEAINAADSGDLIFVHHGTYNESLTVDKEGLHIIGENKLTTIIDLDRATNIRILAGNVTLEGFTIANSRSPYALYVESDGNLITNNIFASNYGGIYCGLADESGPVFDNVIRSNEFRNNSQLSVHLNIAMQNAVSENTFMDNYWGIAVYGGSFDNVICHNTLWRTGSVCIAVQNSPRSTIADNRIDGGTAGIYVDVGSDDTTVSGNELANVQGIWGVIYLMSNVNVTVKDNTLSGNSGGIYLNHARNAVLTNNSMNDNEYGLGIYGGQLAHYVHSIDSSNTINGKPVYYIINSDDLEINASTHSEVGFLAIVNSTNVRVEDLTVTRNLQGFLLAYTTLSQLKNVTVAQCFSGIELCQSSENLLTESNILNNTYGLRLLQGSTATVCRNNFLNNANKPQCSEPSVWDDGVEGNYWSDYEGEDADLDGLGDTPYSVNANNVDRHPLYGSLSILYAGTWDETRYNVEIVSNSTILDPFFSVEQKAIGFRVKGETTGFCRVTINEALLKGPYTVEVGGTQVVPLVISNETHSILCFTYVHDVQDVKIEGWEVIPEYGGASASLVPLMLLLLFGLLLAVRKRNS